MLKRETQLSLEKTNPSDHPRTVSSTCSALSMTRCKRDPRPDQVGPMRVGDEWLAGRPERRPCSYFFSLASTRRRRLAGRWLLIEDQATEVRQQITAAEPLALPVSSWRRYQWGKAGLQHVVQGWGSPVQLQAMTPERLWGNHTPGPRGCLPAGGRIGQVLSQSGLAPGL